MPIDPESDAETQLRLHNERRCRRIADLIKRELPADRGFILLTVQRGEGDAPFSSTDYVASIGPKDSLRLLREHIGRLTERTGILGEPTEDTSTVMREHVYALLEGLAGEPPPSASKLWQAFCRARAGQGSVRQRISSFIALGVVAMVELEHLTRQQRKQRQPAAQPPRSEADLAAEEIMRHAVKPSGTQGDTKTTLVADLREKPPSELRDHLIELALAGAFHDYESESATPKVDLRAALLAAGFEDLAQKVIECAYDNEPPTVEQEEELRQEIGPAFFDSLMGQKPRGSA